MKRNDMVAGNFSAPSAREEDIRHTIRGMVTKRLSMLLGVAFVVGAVMSPSSALAATGIQSCGAGGFTGYLWLRSSSAGLRQNVYLYYAIEKGRNSGGNRANIYVSDGGILPILHLANPDNGIQDGQFRLYYGPYNRGSGGFHVRFIFDKSNAPDPSCTTSTNL